MLRRYPNVWFYLDASLAADHQVAAKLVNGKLRQALHLRETRLPNSEGCDFEVRSEHFQRRTSSFADFLLGFPGASGSGNTSGIPFNIFPGLNNRCYATYLQDDWRVSSRLTLNLGLRWDLETSGHGTLQPSRTPVRQQRPYTVGVRHFTGGRLFTNGDHRVPFGNDLNDVPPRVGAAPRLDHKTVIRSGFGITHLPSYTDSGYFNGFSNVTQYIQSVEGNFTPANSLSNPFPQGLIRPSGSAGGLATLTSAAFGKQSNAQTNDPRIEQVSMKIQF